MTDRILTLVFTDLEESTALKVAQGDAHAAELIARHRTHLSHLAAEYGGHIIDFAGDGCFLTFETSCAAVLFALQLQQLHAQEPALPQVRIGVHLGEVTESTNANGTPRVEGLAVDLAARIQALARPGRCCSQRRSPHRRGHASARSSGGGRFAGRTMAATRSKAGPSRSSWSRSGSKARRRLLLRLRARRGVQPDARRDAQ